MKTAQMRTWAEVSLENIEHNYRDIRGTLPSGCRYMAVVKANAYGHGAAPVAARFAAAGADYLGVACLEEAAQLRQAGLTLPILILGYTSPRQAAELVTLDITQTVVDETQGRALSQALQGAGQRLKIHLKLDTGMGRLGFPTWDDAALEAARRVRTLPGLEAEGVFTHFAVSDEPDKDYTAEQLARFTAALGALEAGGGRFEIRHCANSGAVINYIGDLDKADCADMVRVGLAGYGLYPGAEHGSVDLRPAMRLCTRVAAVTKHRAGDTISYGRTFTAARDMRLAVLPIGYADGLHRVLSSKLEILLGGVRVKQVGRICMDMCMVDITDGPDVSVGDVATVFGGPALPVEEQAEKAGTISYELVCAVSPRVRRVYTDWK